MCLWSSLWCITGPLLNSHMRMTWGFHCRIEPTLIERRVSPCGHRAVHENSQTLMQIKYDLTGAFIVCLGVCWAMRSAENRTGTTDESFYFTLKKKSWIAIDRGPPTKHHEVWVVVYLKRQTFLSQCVQKYGIRQPKLIEITSELTFQNSTNTLVLDIPTNLSFTMSQSRAFCSLFFRAGVVY